MATVSSRGILSLHDIDVNLTEALHHRPPALRTAASDRVPASGAASRATAHHARPLARAHGPPPKHTKGLSRKRIDVHRSQVQKAFSTLREDRLADLLSGYGEYPAKYRKYIWKQLLQLPENTTVYQNLLDKGTHSAFAQFHQVGWCVVVSRLATPSLHAKFCGT